MKKILILNAHPYDKSFCNALAQKYYEGAINKGFDAKIVNLRELKFDPILHGGYTVPTPLEEDLKHQQELITWSEHLVIVTPLWWAGLPALFKGYVDRVLHPGFAFKYTESSPKPLQLLKGRSATVIYTQGAPFLFSYLFVKDGFWNVLNKGILSFCGFAPVKRIVFDQVPKATEQKREKWLKKVYELGQKGK